MHGNAKGDEEIAMAVEHGIGLVVVDNARRRRPAGGHACRPAAAGRPRARRSPASTADTHAHVLTGQTGSKFGLTPAAAAELIAADRPQPAAAHARRARARRLADPRLEPFAAVGGSRSPRWASSTSTTSAAASARATRYADHPPSVADYLDALIDAARAHLPPRRGDHHRARPQHGRLGGGHALPRGHRQARREHVRRGRRRDGRQPRGRAVRPALRGRRSPPACARASER